VQPAATQLHRCVKTGIRVELCARVASDARFLYLPLELIPFAETIYHQRVHLTLERGAQAIVSEVATPGRLWERFQYRDMDLRTEVWLEGRRTTLDVQRVVPSQHDPCLALAGHSHCGSLHVLGPDLGQADADRLHECLNQYAPCASASLLPEYGIAARLLGHSADQLLRAISHAVSLAIP
jgi:urease accessory protein UreH